jgi:hypothetical protein
VRLSLQIMGGAAVYVALLTTIYREHLGAFRQAFQILKGPSKQW